MKKLNKKGFTLVEMLVVIAIIAILVSILIPTVMGATKKAKASTDAANLRSAVAAFQIEYLSSGMADPADGVKVGIYTYSSTSGEWTSEAGKAPASKTVPADTTIYIKEVNGSYDASYASGTNFNSKNIAHYAGVAEGKS